MSKASQGIDIVDIDFAGVELRYFAPDPGDHIQRVLRSEGRVYEDGLLLDCFARKLPQGAIIDVGANIGNHTVVFAKALGRKVVAIEPYPKAFAVLEQNVALNGVAERVTLVAAAAGRAGGRARIQVPPTGNWGRAKVSPADGGEVEIIRLDDLQIQGPVALLKIDVEGMENDVLAGAQRLIKRCRPLVYVETQSPSQYALLKRRLNRLGYCMLRRFNHTPTYLFAYCRSQEDQLAALLDKTDVLTRLDDLAAGQRDLARLLGRLATESIDQFPNVGELGAKCNASRAAELAAWLHEARQTLESQLSSIANEQGALSSSVRMVTEALDNAMAKISDRLAAELRQFFKRDLRLNRRAVRRRQRYSRDEHEVQVPLKLGRARFSVRLSTATASTGRTNGTVSGRWPAPKEGNGAHLANRAKREQTGAASEGPCANASASVIMTTCNSEKFVAEAARNVLAQSHRDLELIIIDDASSDGTWEVLAQLAREDPRVRPVKMFANRGTYWCKNYGITIARGRYVTFQDSDDRSHRDRIHVQLREVLDTGAVACTCNYVRVDADGAIVNNRGVAERKAIMAVMFDREEVLRHAGYFDSVRTSADDEFTRRLGIVFGQERICHVDRPLYLATIRDGSLTMNSRTRAEIDGSCESPADKSFLSPPRREYVRQYTAWHERLKAKQGSPRMPFPLLRRRFPAPSLLLPDPAERDSFVTISMASIPAREPFLRQTVDSVLPQADALNIYLNGYSATPKWLRDERIHVIHSREYGDLRDNGKFFFLDALLGGYHFTIDDDIIYPPDYVQKLILKIEQYDRRAVVGVHGVILANPIVRFMEGRTVYHFKQAAGRDAFVNLLGTGTTAYHTDTLNLSLADFKHPGMADVWLAIAAKRQGIPMVAVQRPKQWLRPLAEAEDTSLFAAARLDDTVQTSTLKEEGSWDVQTMCEASHLCQELRSRFTPDELASQGVDVESLGIDATSYDRAPSIDSGPHNEPRSARLAGIVS